MRTRITPNTHTFHAVIAIKIAGKTKTNIYKLHDSNSDEQWKESNIFIILNGIQEIFMLKEKEYIFIAKNFRKTNFLSL